MPAACGVAVVSIVLVVHPQWNPTIDTVFFNQVINAPIKDAFKVLEVDYSEAAKELAAKDIAITGAATIKDIWGINRADPQEVIELILEQRQ